MSDTKPIQMSAEEAALHKEYRRLLMVREDERDHARIAEVRAAINAFHPSMRPLDEEEIDQCIADLKARKRLEQLRDLPRVTAADRERYKRLARGDGELLSLYEPEHSWLERKQNMLLGTRDGFPLAEWHQWWRSLPDYDGPPMRAPSGTDYHRVFRADGSSRVSIPLRVEAPSFVGNAQLAALFGEVEEYCGPRDWGGPHIAPCPFRGWCPKLAGVSE